MRDKLPLMDIFTTKITFLDQFNVGVTDHICFCFVENGGCIA